MKQQIICIDARLWGVNHTGPGRYTQNLLRFLPRSPGINITVIVSPQNFSDPQLVGFDKVVAKYHPYSIMSQFEIAGLLYRLRPDLYHATHFTIPIFWWGKMVVTIHDLIKHYSRGSSTTTRHPFLYWFKYLGYLFTVWLAVRRAAHIIVPSNYWKQVLMSKYHLSSNQVTVTYEAVDPAYLTASVTPVKLPFTEPFVVHTGNLYPHKNINTLIEAVDNFDGELKLVLVCARSVFADRLPKSNHILFLGRLTDSQLKFVYHQALAYVFPSFVEGFGLPGSEAMATKLPVISSNSSCLPEIYGAAALYFDPTSPGQLVKRIRELQANPDLRKKLIASGTLQVKKYSWTVLGKTTWQIYRSVLH